MIFSSPIFLFYFLPVFLLFYYTLPWKNTVLFIGSLLFYAWGEPKFLILFVILSVVNYFFGVTIKEASQKNQWKILCAGIVLNLAVLIYYKYINFFIINTSLVLGLNVKTVDNLILPLGISFFTFQNISYLIDVSRGDVKPQRSIFKFTMFQILFPQLIAGPIVRYAQVENEIDKRAITNFRIWFGFQRFILGMSQKVLIANAVAIPADRVFSIAPEKLSMLSAWVGIACYTIQIFYDFAGYSNMAIGLGEMMGFSFPQNFNQPYSSRSITEFWRKWHMSLSTWFRDYLYIPLGGNRISPIKTYFNLVLVFILCGFWHGAAWTFIFWGAWHGTLLVIERLGFKKFLDSAPSIVSQSYTIFMIMIGWVFFRADDMTYGYQFIGIMLGFVTPLLERPWQLDLGSNAAIALVLGIFFSFSNNNFSFSKFYFKLNRRASLSFEAAAITLLFILSVASLAAGTYNPFIYFRF